MMIATLTILVVEGSAKPGSGLLRGHQERDALRLLRDSKGLTQA